MRTLACWILLLLALPLQAQTAKELLKQAFGAAEKGMADQAIELATRAIKADPKSIEAHAIRAALYEGTGKFLESAADYTRILELGAVNPSSIYHDRGRVYFKAAKFKESIADFDKEIELDPRRKISHWQRGIAYYYAGRYDDGRKQFEGYREFDSNDVENAVWRFMCMTKTVGIEKARKDMLKIGNDKRVPMRQIYDLYKGDLKIDDVFATVKANNPEESELNARNFYAHLYVGIYYDLLGDRAKAFEHLNIATEKHRIAHTMWDVARVHRDLLAKERKK